MSLKVFYVSRFSQEEFAKNKVNHSKVHGCSVWVGSVEVDAEGLGVAVLGIGGHRTSSEALLFKDVAV